MNLNEAIIEKAPHTREPAWTIGSKAAGRAGAIAFAASLLLVAAQPHDARAQLISGSGPLDISGDHSELLQNGKELVFRGRVEVLRGSNRLHCDTLQVFFRPKHASQGPQSNAGSGALDTSNVERIVADGNVYIVSNDQVVRGDTAIYTADADTVVTTGKEVILMRGEDVGVGTRLVVQRSQGVATLEGGPDGRPRMIIFPKETPASAPAAAQ